jgi:hypothetical protein
MSKEGAAHNSKQVTLTAQKLEIIRKLGRGKSQSVVTVSYNIGLSYIYNIQKQKDQLL